jgi:hypothetical protein
VQSKNRNEDILVEIDPFRDLSSCDRQKDCSSTVVTCLSKGSKLDSPLNGEESRDMTCLSIVVKSDTRLGRIWCFHKDKLVLPDLVQDPLRIELDLRTILFAYTSSLLTISFQAATMDSMYR